MCGVKDDLQVLSWHLGNGGNENWDRECRGSSRLGDRRGGSVLLWRMVRVLCEILPYTDIKRLCL